MATRELFLRELWTDPGVDNNDIEMMHESLLGAGPSGIEGRPGSAPQKK